jgi:myo-inositol-1(or 4)-monophosphatase
MTMDLIVGTCNAIARAVSRLSLAESGKVLQRGAGGDFTKMIDLVAEEAAVTHLQESGFRGTLVSEELGRRQFGSELLPILILDPVDGTTNAVRGMNFYAISMAASRGPRLADVFAGVVMELPTKRTFTAEKGKGAALDAARIAMPSPPPLKDSLIGVDLNVQGDRRKLDEIIPLVLGAKHIRNMGSAALELCLVACGGLDLYVDNRGLLRVTDIAASCLILKEAGALVLDLEGSPLDCPIDLSERISLIAGAKKICAEALAIIRRK